MALIGKSKGSGKNDRSSLTNAAKTLLANIRFISVDNPVRTIAITSAVPNEGKTFVTVNLASAIATSEKTVLLVECDMRRRSMAGVLGAHAQYGLYSVLAGEVSLEDAIIETSVRNRYFLDAEPHIPNPSDILNSERFSLFINQALGIFDYVVFDTPPVGTFVDAAVLGTKVDAVFMVVREGFARKADIAAAAEQLRKSGCNLTGAILNYCERRDSEYYYEYYYSQSGAGDDHAPSLDKVKSAAGKSSAPILKQQNTTLPSRPARASRAGDTHAGSAADTYAQQRPAQGAESSRGTSTYDSQRTPAGQGAWQARTAGQTAATASAPGRQAASRPGTGTAGTARTVAAARPASRPAATNASRQPSGATHGTTSVPSVPTPSADSPAYDGSIMDTSSYVSLASMSRLSPNQAAGGTSTGERTASAGSDADKTAVSQPGPRSRASIANIRIPDRIEDDF